MAAPLPAWYGHLFDAARFVAFAGLAYWIVVKGRGVLRPRDGSRVGGLFFSLIELVVLYGLALVVIVGVEAAVALFAIRHGAW